jgi:hypothetical protein
MLTTTADPPFHLFLSLTDPTARYDSDNGTKLTIQDPPGREEAGLWNGHVGHLLFARNLLIASVNGYGGKLDPGETMDECARRELFVSSSRPSSRVLLSSPGRIRSIRRTRGTVQMWSHHFHTADCRKTCRHSRHWRIFLLCGQRDNGSRRVSSSTYSTLSPAHAQY